MPAPTQGGFDLKWFLQTKSGGDGRPKPNRRANGMLTRKVPAAAEVAAAAAKAAEVAAQRAADRDVHLASQPN